MLYTKSFQIYSKLYTINVIRKYDVIMYLEKKNKCIERTINHSRFVHTIYSTPPTQYLQYTFGSAQPDGSTCVPPQIANRESTNLASVPNNKKHN